MEHRASALVSGDMLMLRREDDCTATVKKYVIISMPKNSGHFPTQ